MRLSADATVAQRSDSFCKGICFSNRPIRINERVCIKFSEISQSWSGALRFGFTTNDPSIHRSGLPKYACPDLTNKPGNWAKALGERFAVRDYVLFFYVNEMGEVHYGINGEDRGVFFSGVTTNCPLWALIDIYGNTVKIESVDPRQQVNHRRNSYEVETIIPSLSTIDINRENREPSPQVYRNTNFESLPFHKTKGCNIRLSNDRFDHCLPLISMTNNFLPTTDPLPNATIVITVKAMSSLNDLCVWVRSLSFKSCKLMNFMPEVLPSV